MMPLVTVAAAALIRNGSEILMAQRPFNRSMPGLWEFPGGKLEAGETPEAALVRELEEELRIVVKTEELQPVTFVSHRYNKFHLLMLLYIIDKFDGRPQPREHADLQWLTIETIYDLSPPPADLPLLAPLAAFMTQGTCSIP